MPPRTAEICWIVVLDISPIHWVVYALAVTDRAVVVCPFAEAINWNTFSSAAICLKIFRRSFSNSIVRVYCSSWLGLDCSVLSLILSCWWKVFVEDLMVRGTALHERGTWMKNFYRRMHLRRHRCRHRSGSVHSSRGHALWILGKDGRAQRGNVLCGLSWLRSFQEGWKFFFNHGGLISAPKARRRKQRTS